MPFTIDDMRALLRMMGEIYECARLVDPADCQVLLLTEDGRLVPDGRRCFAVWDRQVRCVDCISERAVMDNSRVMKREAVDGRVYSVTTRRVTVIESGGRAVDCCLEVACCANERDNYDDLERDELILKVVDAQRRMYVDSLTGAYSRRYYDELAFCRRPGFAASGEVVFVMADLKQFKQINDRFGHDAGDVALKCAAEIMMRSVGPHDSVIRIGGDEFLLVLPDCAGDCARDTIERIRQGFRDAAAGPGCAYRLVGNFGVAATRAFRADKALTDRLLGEADRLMYRDKNCDRE